MAVAVMVETVNMPDMILQAGRYSMLSVCPPIFYHILSFKAACTKLMKPINSG